MGEVQQKFGEVSVLRGEGSYFKRILSRDPSVGQSSSNGFLYYCPGSVPFDWEMKPGESKTPPKTDEPVPAISPPPILSSVQLIPRPRLCDPPKGSGWKSRVKFWRKKIRRHRNSQKKIEEGKRSVDDPECRDIRSGENHMGDRLSDFGGVFSEPCGNSSSSSSSCTSSREFYHLPLHLTSKLHTLAKDLSHAPLSWLHLRR